MEQFALPELPEIIDVLGRKFVVKILEPGMHEDSDGLMSLTQQEIWVRLHPAEDCIKDTILHETIHAVDEILHLELEERQIHLLASGLMAVLKQNKDLAKWLLQ